ncbi:MAG TPA: hypothetical protein DGT21_00205 [Armatimonadetes bacterium]|nr:hypothetical protein [Armatimonadota bacterium]
MGLEAVDPHHVLVFRHGRHVMPLAVRGVGEEVQVLAGDVKGAPQAAFGIADGVVVVQVAEVEVP